MRVLVTGATGFIGSAIVRELLDAGHEVLGLARNDHAADTLAQFGVTAHRGDLSDLDSLAAGARVCDGVIHTAFGHDFSKYQEAGETDRHAVEAMANALVGTSAGGGLVLATVQRAKADGLPLPGAIAPLSPWSDLTETGDSYQANEWIDNVLVSYKGYLGRAALLYAHGRNLCDPELSPIYGNVVGFPPAILIAGTWDLFLSNTVRTHRKLRRAGVETEIQVFEGLSHAQFHFDLNLPETREIYKEVARFFDKHLAG